MIKIRSYLCLAAFILPVGLFSQIEFIVGEYLHAAVQTGPDITVPFGTYNGFAWGANFVFEVDVVANEGNLSAGTVTGPSFPGGQALVADDGEYYFDAQFATIGALQAAIQPGTYTVEVTEGSLGQVSETLDIGAYNKLSSLKVTNFAALQSYDPGQEIVISWEEFTEGQGEGISAGYNGFIEVWITGFNQSGAYDAWTSEQLTAEDGFGLLPTTTSVTIPANTLVPGDFYNLNLYFARIDSAKEATNASGALVATVTSYELELRMTESGMSRTWTYYPIWNEVVALTGEWLGPLNVRLAPWVWAPTQERWLFIPAASVTPDGGWVFVPAP